MVSVLTIVPISLATDLCEKKTIKDYNTLPQLNPVIIETIREFMTENVGYSDLPIASLRTTVVSNSNGRVDIFKYLSANSKENVLFQLDMPEDMVVSVKYETLLDYSRELTEFSDDMEMARLIRDEFKQELFVGNEFNQDDIISFIPFLEYNRCKFYAKFDSNFKLVEMDIPGIDKFPIAKLSAFVD